MGLPEQALQHSRDTLDQVIGQAIMALHRQGKTLGLGSILTYLTERQESESDEATRYFIGVAIALLSI
ncbi:hypothetical protein ABK905_16640 [Acerihabitans sp. KWT182]|uniref:ANTAR domain-containing protein n=1 Tax=Acerihabitans sp. KWT182 TaxID=3157919 RepID=A0AAU7Q7I0_9GAMM